MYMLQAIFKISQYYGMTEPISQSIELSDTTSQYIGLPENICHPQGLPEKYFNFYFTSLYISFKGKLLIHVVIPDATACS